MRKILSNTVSGTLDTEENRLNFEGLLKKVLDQVLKRN